VAHGCQRRSSRNAVAAIHTPASAVWGEWREEVGANGEATLISGPGCAGAYGVFMAHVDVTRPNAEKFSGFYSSPKLTPLVRDVVAIGVPVTDLARTKTKVATRPVETGASQATPSGNGRWRWTRSCCKTPGRLRGNGVKGRPGSANPQPGIRWICGALTSARNRAPGFNWSSSQAWRVSNARSGKPQSSSMRIIGPSLVIDITVAGQRFRGLA
jgi:hypothetical protein